MPITTSTTTSTMIMTPTDSEHDGYLASGRVLAFFGVGRVPFMVVWGTFFIFTGFGGIYV